MQHQIEPVSKIVQKTFVMVKKNDEGIAWMGFFHILINANTKVFHAWEIMVFK